MSTSSTELAQIAEWLRGTLERIRDQAQAASSRSEEWSAEAEQPSQWGVPADDLAVIAAGKPIVKEDREYSGGDVVEHIALNDPRSVLARVAAELVMLGDLEVEAGQGDPERLNPMTEAEAARISAEIQLRWLAYGHRYDGQGYHLDWAPRGA